MNVEETAPVSARADRQEDFFAKGVLELPEIEGRLAFVTQHFKHRGTAFLGNLDTSALDIHDVHLQRFHQKIPVVAAMRTG